MPSSNFAESLLSLVTSQQRAAAMVGDFTESSRGALWFWSSVLRAGFSLLWKDVAASPERMTALAVSGAAMHMAFSAPFLVCLFAMIAPVAIIPVALHLDTSWVVSLFLMILTAAILSPFLVGRWLARRAPGSELAPCLALTLLTAILWTTACLVWGKEVSLMNGLSGVVPTFLCLFAANIFLYMGAIRARRHPAGLKWFEAFPSVLLPEPLAPTDKQRQRKIGELSLAGEFPALMLVQALGLPTARGPLYAVLAGLFALVCLGYAASERLYKEAGVSRGMSYWIGIVGMGVFAGWTAWLALR